jgi:hypothetical protein
MPHAHTQTHHFNLGRVVAAFNYTSVSSFFWEIQRLLWQSFGLALRILFVFFLTHHLMFDKKKFTSGAYGTRFLHCTRNFQRLLTGSPPNRRKDEPLLGQSFPKLRRHIPFGVIKFLIFFFLSVLVVVMY